MVEWRCDKQQPEFHPRTRYIDFWAIDFNWQPDKPFSHGWQDYRTRKDRSLKTISDATYQYLEPGNYITIKVVETFVCDTSITVKLEM